MYNTSPAYSIAGKCNFFYNSDKPIDK